MLITADMLLENSKKINSDKRETIKIHINELNGEIECELLNKEDYLDLIFSKEKDKEDTIHSSYRALFAQGRELKRLFGDRLPEIKRKVLEAFLS